MFLSKIKRGIATMNMKFRLSAIKEMTRTAVRTFAPNEFAKYVKHLKLEEMKYKEVNTQPIHSFEAANPNWSVYTSRLSVFYPFKY